jgi:hypothetical protein
MYREQICANPTWKGNCRFDTVFVTVSENDSKEGTMCGMLVACVLLFFSYHDPKLCREFPCALVHWFLLASQEPDPVTGSVAMARTFGSNILLLAAQIA